MIDSLAPLSLPTVDAAEPWLAGKARSGLARAADLVAALKQQRPRDAMTALELWNDISIELANVAAAASFFSEAHPVEAVRTRGEQAMQDVQKVITDLGLDRDLYDIFAAVDGAFDVSDVTDASLARRACRGS